MTSVEEHLRARGVAFEPVSHEPADTSIDEARALGVPADEVVKTVVLDTESGHALAVIPASRRLDMRLVRAAVGDRHAGLASEEELERDFPDSFWVPAANTTVSWSRTSGSTYAGIPRSEARGGNDPSS
jgi:hypothetical protein